MPSATFALILQAMEERKNVVAMYHGFERHMSPHTLGHKNGREKALLYQFAGGSSSGLGAPGSPDNWRCLFVDQLSAARIEGGDWRTAIGGHSRPQTCVGEIVLEIFG
jgi:hypothetical protein